MDLLEALIKIQVHGENDTYGYHFERATEGYNGIVYKVSDKNGASYAAKIAHQTARQRAWREYTITKAIHDAGIDNICPKPLQLFSDVQRLNGDVIISTWLDGDLLVMPPKQENKTLWLAILQTLAQVHRLEKSFLPDEIPMASTPVQNPQDMLAIIYARFANLKHENLGHLTYHQVETVIKALEARIPQKWDMSAPLRLIHADCHTANMILSKGRIALVDWENSGFADPAFDISTMTTLWRFFDLPESHHQWLIATYAVMLHDSWLEKRIHVYRMIQIVHWVVNYSLFIQRRSNEKYQATGQHRFSLDFQLNWQAKYYQRACELLDLP